MLFRYERQALSYALTPSLIGLLLDRGFSQVMFVKQESLVLGELPFDALGSIALTPHLLEPIGAEEELPILLAGAYNGGLVGVADRPQGRAFLAWWAERLREHCVREPHAGCTSSSAGSTSCRPTSGRPS